VDILSHVPHVHFIGIGGYGMSAIAAILLDQGYRVSGSDMDKKELTDKLVDRGAKVYIGHQPEYVEGADIVVYSTGIPSYNVELMEARNRNMTLLHRSEMLARLLNEKNGIAIAGAHGKTTTTSMISTVLEKCGMDPSYLIGGEVVELGGNARAGTSQYVVAEADESDGTFLQYHPFIGIVTNVEPDHLENYEGDFDKLKAAYRQFLSQIKPGGLAVINYDDPFLRELSLSLKCRVATYGIESNAEVVARQITYVNRTVSFSVEMRGERLGYVTLSIPGKHNVYNALATIITCLDCGAEFSAIADALHQFKGAKRRFQVLYDRDGLSIVDDYAHHPTEIEATILAAKATGKRIIAVFQPQRYTRTHFLFDAFSRAFAAADIVVIMDIYSPIGEMRIEGVNAEKLAGLVKQNSNPNTVYLPTREEVKAYLKTQIGSNDLVLTMGAGDVWKVGHELAEDYLLKTNYQEG
jgi:UDP-N-acetylmuramate--alanine ligase